MNQFSPRSLDVDVVLDLMIHDVDIVLSLVAQAGAPSGSPALGRPGGLPHYTEPAEVRAAGVRILSDKVDIANVRLQFANGCVANLTASRVSTEKIRKLRLFQPRQYLSLDYGRQDLAIFWVGEGGRIGFEQAQVMKIEPLRAQLESFLECIRTRQTPKCSGPEARQTLGVALTILDKIKEHSEVVSETLSQAGWKQ
jgi:predicted dehydrogenase